MKKERRWLFKKLTAFVVMTVLLSTVSVAAFATQTTTIPVIDTNADVSLTITKYEAEDGDDTALDDSVTGEQQNVDRTPLKDVNFTALKIGDLKQGRITEADGDPIDGTVQLTCELNADGAKLLNRSYPDTYKEGDKVPIDVLKTFIANKTARGPVLSDLGNTATWPNAITATTGADGIAKFTSKQADVTETDGSEVWLKPKQGVYIISETAAPISVTKRSHPFLLSLPMSSRTTQNDWLYDVYAYPKNTLGSTDIDKKIDKVNNGNGGILTGNEKAGANIGDVITFRVPFTISVPDNGLSKLEIKDTMSKGLKFTGETDVKIERADNDDVLVKGTDFTVSSAADASDSAKTVVTIAFTSTYLTKLNNDARAAADPVTSPQFNIYYNAKLDSDAVLGNAGNKNSVLAYYRQTGDTKDTETPKNEVTVYTCGIDLTKMANDADSTKLNGVQFVLKKSRTGTADTDYYYFDETTGESESAIYYYPILSGTEADRILTTNASGKLVIRGLKSGTYYLEEVKTANGYVLLNEPIQISITFDSTTNTYSAQVNGNDVTLHDDSLNTTSKTALVPLDVVNSQGFLLPSTGGVGTTMLTIAGVVLVVLSVILLIRMKRKQSRE